MNYFRNLNANISPEEFEIKCLELLKQTKDFEILKDIKVEHNKLYKANDGIYQLDGYIEYMLFGVKMKIIVECKQYRSPVKRDMVVLLHSKLNSIGANKGILMSTSGFQSGAVEYAKEHGVALLQVIDKLVLTIQNSVSQHKILLNVISDAMPKHVIMMYDLNCDFPFYKLPNDKEELMKFLTNV